MHSKFFSQIYDNKLNTNFSSIERSKADNILSERFVANRLKSNKPLTDTELEILLEKSRRSPNQKFTKEEAALLNREKEVLDKEVDTVLKEINTLRESINKNVSDSNDSYTLKLNSSQRSAAIEVFGEEKTELTYADYTTLLELKKLLDIDETFAIISEEL